MSNISAYLQKAYLDWSLGGAAPTAATARWAGLASAAPTSVGGSELPATAGYTRITAQFGAAASPAGTASNQTAMTFGPFSSANLPIIGLCVYDERTLGGNNIHWYGTLNTARTAQVGDSLYVAAGALIIGIS